VETSALLVATSIFGSSFVGGLAQTTTALNAEATRMNTLASSQGDSKVVDKISSDFSSFLGGHSKAVVTRLRNGTPITLRDIAPTDTTGAQTAETTIINPPSGKMGHRHHLYLASAGEAEQLGEMAINGSGSWQGSSK